MRFSDFKQSFQSFGRGNVATEGAGASDDQLLVELLAAGVVIYGAHDVGAGGHRGDRAAD